MPSPPAPLHWPAEPLSDGVVALDRMTSADLDAIVEACRDPETQRWLPLPDPYERADAEEFLGAQPDNAARGEAIVFALRAAGSTVLAGSIGLSFADGRTPRGVGQLGYWTHPAHRRRGLTGRGVRLAAAYGFRAATVHRIEILVEPGNEASAGVALAAGAQPEGIRRNGLVHERTDRIADTLVYAFVPDDL